MNKLFNSVCIHASSQFNHYMHTCIVQVISRVVCGREGFQASRAPLPGVVAQYRCGAPPLYVSGEWWVLTWAGAVVHPLHAPGGVFPKGRTPRAGWRFADMGGCCRRHGVSPWPCVHSRGLGAGRVEA